MYVTTEQRIGGNKKYCCKFLYYVSGNNALFKRNTSKLNMNTVNTKLPLRK